MTTRGIAMPSRAIPDRSQLSETDLQVEQMWLLGKTYREMTETLGLKRHVVAKHIDRVRDVRAFELMRRAGQGPEIKNVRRLNHHG